MHMYLRLKGIVNEFSAHLTRQVHGPAPRVLLLAGSLGVERRLGGTDNAGAAQWSCSIIGLLGVPSLR